MNQLIESALKTWDEHVRNSKSKLSEQTKAQARECFGELANTSLVETDDPNELNIVGTQWKLVNNMCGGFYLFHKENNKPEYQYEFSTEQICNTLDLGMVLNSLIKRSK